VYAEPWEAGVTNVLTPNAKQQLFDNKGLPAVGYKVFTYAAGTSTKLATKVSPLGADNANPIILDYRGEANIWIAPNVAYKYVLAPPTDTDPPTHAIWTVDNVVSSQLITLYGGVDTGSVNAYVLTFTANFTAYTDGIIIYWIPANTNTGPSTLNVNGLGALAIVDAQGSPLSAGAIVANQVTAVIMRSGQWALLSVSTTTGSFTATLTGYGVNPTGTVFYKIAGGSCTLFVTSTLTGVSNTTTMGMTGVPAVCRPIAARSIICGDLIDNAGTGLAGSFSITAAGVVSFGIAKTNTVANFVQNSAVGFSNVGNKGLLNGWTVTYPL
jgi:hypothetical protein